MRNAGASTRSAKRTPAAKAARAKLAGKARAGKRKALAVPRARSLGKTRVTIYFDTAVVEFFKKRAGQRGYQTLINEALRAAIDRATLEDVLRRVVKEEMATYSVVRRR
jgi:uncharacterized protein (DUF4415 family)